MPKLKFVAFLGLGYTSKMIRFVTRSKWYSHIAFLDESEGGDSLIECWPWPGNRFQKWGYSSFSNHTPGTPYEIWELEVPPDVYQTCWNFYHFLAEKGEKYDWAGVIGFVFKMIRDKEDRRFCSEGCIEPLVLKMGWSVINPAHVSPQDFVNIIQVAGGKRIFAKGVL